MFLISTNYIFVCLADGYYLSAISFQVDLREIFAVLSVVLLLFYTPAIKLFIANIFVAGILSLGCFFGCIIAGPIMERIGRKKTLLFVTSSCFFLGYLAIFLANHVALIYLGR